MSFDILYTKAHEAGMKAVENVIPVPMIVATPKTLFGSEIDTDEPVYVVNDGVCGFAWITVKPGNSKFANWLKKTGRARSAYGGGVMIWVGLFNQSMTRKKTYAYAFAKVLCENGIKAYADSRMD